MTAVACAKGCAQGMEDRLGLGHTLEPEAAIVGVQC